MDQATTFSYVMRSLWGDDDVPKEAFAIAAYIKTHGHINHENALDVLGIMWSDAAKTMRWTLHDDDAVTIAHVTFADGSRASIETKEGIGSGITWPPLCPSKRPKGDES